MAILRNPATRKAVVKAAQNAKVAFKKVATKTVQACKYWKRNRAIRQAYNSRMRTLEKEIKAMRKQGRTRKEIAEHAHKVRHKERIAAREKMKKNGDAKDVENLEARDLKKYKNKDGPNFEQSQARAKNNLKKKLGREPTQDEVYDEIAESATGTDWVTNLKFLSY